MATVFHSLGDRTIYKSSLGYDPLLKNGHGEMSQNKTVAQNRCVLYLYMNRFAHMNTVYEYQIFEYNILINILYYNIATY